MTQNDVDSQIDRTSQGAWRISLWTRSPSQRYSLRHAYCPFGVCNLPTMNAVPLEILIVDEAASCRRDLAFQKNLSRLGCTAVSCATRQQNALFVHA